MSYPQNPETIILKNRFYPKGLTEKIVYEYYIKNKNLIMNQIRNRDVMFAIMVDINKPVIRRKLSGKNIKLTNTNYDQIITGRTITLYSTMGFYEDMAIVDLDADSFDIAKDVARDVYPVLMNIPAIKSCEIRYTGKTGFHLLCNFVKKIKIDDSKEMIQSYLMKTDLKNKYTIAPKRRKGIPNIDLWAANKKNGAFITLHSLSIIGLKCINIQFNELNKFRAIDAKI